MVNTNMALALHTRSFRLLETGWGHQPQAASYKPQASSSKLRQFVAVDIMINPIYSYTRAAKELVSIRSGISHAKRASREKQAAAPNKRRKNDQRNNKSRLSSRWSETGRSKENCHQISTGPNPGDAAGTPSLPHIGSQVHRDRISGPSKSSQQRSSSRVCLELITPAREQRANQPTTQKAAHKHTSVSVQARANKRG